MEFITKWFGTWVQTANSSFGAATAVVSGAVAAIQIASHFGDPLFRWVAMSIVALLFIGGWIFGTQYRQSRLLDAEGYPFRVRTAAHLPAFAWGALASIAFLVFDLGWSFAGFIQPIEVRGPRFLSSGNSIMVTKAVARELSSIPVIGFTHLEQLTAEDMFDPATRGAGVFFDFDLKKKEMMDEVVIENVELVVSKYRPFPSHYGEVSPAEFTQKAVLFFELNKRQQELPWRFRPHHVFIDEELREWTSGLLSLRDGFQSPFRVRMAAVDPGIYDVRLEIEASSRFGGTSTVPIGSKPTSFGFYGQGEQGGTPEDKVLIQPFSRF